MKRALINPGIKLYFLITSERYRSCPLNVTQFLPIHLHFYKSYELKGYFEIWFLRKWKLKHQIRAFKQQIINLLYITYNSKKCESDDTWIDILYFLYHCYPGSNESHKHLVSVCNEWMKIIQSFIQKAVRCSHILKKWYRIKMWFICQLIQKFMVEQKTIHLCNVYPLSSAIKQLHNEPNIVMKIWSL